MADPERLTQLSRPELISRASELGVERAERLTRLELIDEILRLTKTGVEQVEARGLFGVARAMVADVMEKGLNLPDAAALIRGTTQIGARVEPRVPVATVTLAEIYAAQGHRDRALRMIDKVLTDEPEHSEAQRLKDALAREAVALTPQGAEVAVSTDYEPAVVWETTGEKVKTGEPPPVAELLPLPASPSPSLSPDFAAADSAPPKPPTAPVLDRQEPVSNAEPESTLAGSTSAGSDEPVRETFAEQGSVELSWSGPALTVSWRLSHAKERKYCVVVTGFEKAMGRPRRNDARFLLAGSEPTRSGELRCPEFTGQSACAALGFLEENELFVPIAVSSAIGPLASAGTPPRVDS
jgi:predicted XRE-type DNA-binding protein